MLEILSDKICGTAIVRLDEDWGLRKMSQSEIEDELEWASKVEDAIQSDESFYVACSVKFSNSTCSIIEKEKEDGWKTGILLQYPLEEDYVEIFEDKIGISTENADWIEEEITYGFTVGVVGDSIDEIYQKREEGYIVKIQVDDVEFEFSRSGILYVRDDIIDVPDLTVTCMPKREVDVQEPEVMVNVKENLYRLKEIAVEINNEGLDNIDEYVSLIKAPGLD